MGWQGAGRWLPARRSGHCATRDTERQADRRLHAGKFCAGRLGGQSSRSRALRHPRRAGPHAERGDAGARDGARRAKPPRSRLPCADGLPGMSEGDWPLSLSSPDRYGKARAWGVAVCLAVATLAMRDASIWAVEADVIGHRRVRAQSCHVCSRVIARVCAQSHVCAQSYHSGCKTCRYLELALLKRQTCFDSQPRA